MSRMIVAETILAQLGGAGRLGATIGAHSFSGHKDCLIFKIKARAEKSIKAVKVILTPADTYTVEFWSIRGFNVTKVAEVEDVYCDSLRNVIETQTGLRLSL